jgi:hypothetical protein
VHAVILLFNGGMLQARTAILEVQNLVSRPADGDSWGINYFVTVLGTAGGVNGNESDQILHDVTST